MAKKREVGLISGLVVLLGLVAIISCLIFGLIKKENSSQKQNVIPIANQNLAVQNIDNKKARLIDGLKVSDDYKNFYPIAVVIENSADAWPLAGIDKANLVYETTAEAGITRLLVFYASDDIIDKIGPVRSARPYFIDWAKEYNAILAHVGGSPEALLQIKKDQIIDLDQYFKSQYFWRDSSRAAPHNVYTSSALLKEARNNSVKDELPAYDSCQYKDDFLLEKRPDSQNIEINFSTPLYKVNWQYDKEKNDYLRLQAEKKYLTDNGSEVRTKNIIVQYAIVKITDKVGRRDITTIGQGKALFFIDGQAIDGYWKRSNGDQRTNFSDKDGKEIQFNRGTTWIEVVSADTLIGYK